MLVHRRVTPSIKFAGTHLYTYVERGNVTAGKVCCPRRARTQTARSGVERTNLRPPRLQQLSTGEDIKFQQEKKYMAAVARGIDETSNAVQLNGFFGKTFHFYYLFSPCFRKCNFSCVFICLFLCQSTIFILLFFSVEYHSSF